MVLWRLVPLLPFQEPPFPALSQGLQLLWASQVHGLNKDQGQGPGQGPQTANPQINVSVR